MPCNDMTRYVYEIHVSYEIHISYDFMKLIYFIWFVVYEVFTSYEFFQHFVWLSLGMDTQLYLVLLLTSM